MFTSPSLERRQSQSTNAALASNKYDMSTDSAAFESHEVDRDGVSSSSSSIPSSSSTANNKKTYPTKGKKAAQKNNAGGGGNEPAKKRVKRRKTAKRGTSPSHFILEEEEEVKFGPDFMLDMPGYVMSWWKQVRISGLDGLYERSG